MKDSANINDFNTDQQAEITCAGYEYDFLSGEIYRINEDYENEDEYDNEFDYEDCFTNPYGDPYFIYDKNNYYFPTTEQLYKELNLELLESTEPPIPSLTTSEKIWRYLNKKIFVFNYEITILNTIIVFSILGFIFASLCFISEGCSTSLGVIMFLIPYIAIRNSYSFRVAFLLTLVFTISAFFSMIFIGVILYN